MSELENDYEEIDNEEVESEEVEETESEQDESSELAPDSEGEHEEKHHDDAKVNQEKINAVINRKHREAREAQEESERLRKQLQQLQEQSQSRAPEVLPKPDPFDDDYEGKLSAYEDSIRKRERWQYEQETQTKQRQQLEQQQHQQKLQQLQQTAASYTERATKYGITPEELQTAGNKVAQTGMSDDVAIAILGDEDGPLITKYLASNELEAYQIAEMSPVQAALYIERNIRPKAVALKPKRSNAPKPPTKVNSVSGDKDAERYPHIKGAKFE